MIFLVPGFLLACTNLKPVQQLSTEANRGLQYFHELDYSFASHCRDHCYFQKIQANTIDRDLECKCAVYQEADTVVKDLFLELENYWNGLESLASPELARYDLSSPVKGLQSSKLIDMSEAEASAFQKLSELAVNASTGQYRKKRIVYYMKEADPHLNLISEKLAFILKENLLGLLEIQKESWYAHYKTLSLNENLSPVEKEFAVEKYYRLLEDSEKIRIRIQSIAGLLKLLAVNHSELSANYQNTSQDGFKSAVMRLSKEMRSLHYEFDQLNE
ncbi:hypothetical protein [Cyclobacterium jeungdonense]|uniref:Uncharacterized protein n=1 Tax=Cyclobacterium jeungdonense TaxID=708087 RepID=A0ABT8CCY4_9BACT|nr:hypothetical protein [Cyclobacterium jeungdonense]MDN3689819.1 hypothetical protein [Cyclobacterium jeungdonense]